MSEALTKITAEIVSAYVSKNHLRPDELTTLLKDVHGKLAQIANGKTASPAEAKPQPLMPIRKTITHDYLISLEDGNRYKTLRRHLTVKGLTPDQYRAKWGLPADYPMVCKDYTERRSALARDMGLGRKGAKAGLGETAQAIAEDLVDVIAEDVIKETVAGEAPARKARPTKKAEGKVHPKPKERAKSRKAVDQEQPGSASIE